MIGIGLLLQPVEDDVVGRVRGLPDLLQDHTPLHLDLARVKNRVAQDIGHHIHRQRHVVLEDAGVVGRGLHRGGGVQLAADVLDQVFRVPAPDRLEARLTGLVLQDPVARELTVLDLGQDLPHLVAGLFGDDPRTGDVRAVLRRVRDSMRDPFLDQCFDSAKVIGNARHALLPLIQVRHTLGQGGVNAARLLDSGRKFRGMRRGQRDHRHVRAAMRLGHMHAHGAMRT
jgi:hypothetical protein